MIQNLDKIVFPWRDDHFKPTRYKTFFAGLVLLGFKLFKKKSSLFFFFFTKPRVALLTLLTPGFFALVKPQGGHIAPLLRFLYKCAIDMKFGTVVLQPILNRNMKKN